MKNKILGIDVGGTKIASGLVDKLGKLSLIKVVPTNQTGRLKDQLISIIQSYSGFSGIGIGMPGQVLPNGVVTRLPNIKGFKQVNLRKEIEKVVKKSVTILNDAKAFAFAEAFFGEAKKYHSIVGVVLGTGVGMGIIIGKQIYFGKDGLAGEFDHLPMIDGRMLREHLKQAGRFNRVTDARKYLKIYLNAVVLSFNPDAIVLGGAWSKLSGMKSLAYDLAKNAGGYKNQTPIFISKLKYPGIIGAGFYALKKDR